MKLNNREKYKLNNESVMIACIIILPFAFYLYNFAPTTQSLKTSFFEINSGVFEDVNYYLWFLCTKLLTLIMLTLWYLTCSRKWRSVLLISISFEIYKFFSLIKSSKLGIEFEGISVFETLCYSIPYIIILLIISKKLNYYESSSNRVAPLNNEISLQIIKLTNFDKKQYQLMKKEFKKLEAQKPNMAKKEYLTRLISLRDELTISN